MNGARHAECFAPFFFMQKVFTWIASLAAILAFCVIVLGVWVRLSHAGLGCPDWPGCYGHLSVPQAHEIVNDRGRPFVAEKATKEMVHRYFASTLGLLIMILTILAWLGKKPFQVHKGFVSLLLALVIFQGLLGMWTVTLKLYPLVVMSHLLGGMLTFSLLSVLVLKCLDVSLIPSQSDSRILPRILLGVGLLLVQILLGGWTSSNYAALACPDFPMCQGQWIPAMNFSEAFHLLREVGLDYEFGVLSNPARVTIHMMHRIGAVIVFLYLSHLGWSLFVRAQNGWLKRLGFVVGVLVIVQVLLGISNVLTNLNLSVAVVHTAGAALLLASLFLLTSIAYRLCRLHSSVKITDQKS